MPVESFELDHTKVRAPYVRKAQVLEGPQGDRVTKFDLRFLQPNKAAFKTGVMHTLEHLLAGFLRQRLEGIIDLSPMGCRTGFYLTLWGERESTEIQKALHEALGEIERFADPVPAANEVQCGNAHDHDLVGAREMAKSLMGQWAGI